MHGGGIVGPPDPGDVTYPPRGDKAAWAAWWERFNAHDLQTHEINGTDPRDGIEDINDDLEPLAVPREE